MNNLKKTLGKDDPKKYSKKNVTTTSFKKEVKWADIDDLIECRSIYKKTLQLSLHNHFALIIEKSFESGQMKDFSQMVNSLIAKFNQFNESKSVVKRCNTLQKIIEEISQMIVDQKSAIMKKYLELCLERLDKQLCQERKLEKQINLKEYDNLVKILKPSIKKKQRRVNIIEEKQKQKDRKVMLGSLSGSNLKIKFTQQEYQLKGELKKKKSQGNLGNLCNSPNSKGNQDYKAKLQELLKEPALKLIKTKIQYDYSAILQASKSNIQRRNRTQHAQTGKQGKKKINQLKKDQGFIFYRPKK